MQGPPQTVVNRVSMVGMPQGQHLGSSFERSTHHSLPKKHAYSPDLWLSLTWMAQELVSEGLVHANAMSYVLARVLGKVRRAS